MSLWLEKHQGVNTVRRNHPCSPLRVKEDEVTWFPLPTPCRVSPLCPCSLHFSTSLLPAVDFCHLACIASQVSFLYRDRGPEIIRIVILAHALL